MIEVCLLRSVSSGPASFGDVTVYMMCQLPAIPRSGDTITLEDEIGGNLTLRAVIDNVEYRQNNQTPIIHIHADHGAYKAKNPNPYFIDRVQKYLKAGWKPWPHDSNFKNWPKAFNE